MKKEILFAGFMVVIAALSSCSSVKNSRYSAFNQFHYANEQPRFNFQNDSLKIDGAWNWATGARAIPKISYIPETPLQILKPIAKEHGPVLFATWAPERTKYSVEGYVPVTKEDVRFSSKSNEPFFLVVLMSIHAFKADTSRYKSKGKNNDYQFSLYASAPQSFVNNYWVMQVIAASKDRYYNFVCILDKSFMENQEVRDMQADRFLDDIRQRFLTR